MDRKQRAKRQQRIWRANWQKQQWHDKREAGQQHKVLNLVDRLLWLEDQALRRYFNDMTYYNNVKHDHPGLTMWSWPDYFELVKRGYKTADCQADFDPLYEKKGALIWPESDYYYPKKTYSRYRK